MDMMNIIDVCIVRVSCKKRITLHTTHKISHLAAHNDSCGIAQLPETVQPWYHFALELFVSVCRTGNCAYTVCLEVLDLVQGNVFCTLMIYLYGIPYNRTCCSHCFTQQHGTIWFDISIQEWKYLCVPSLMCFILWQSGSSTKFVFRALSLACFTDIKFLQFGLGKDVRRKDLST